MTPAYTRTQKILHWTVVVLITAQYLLHEAMDTTWEAIENGLPVAANATTMQHIVTGLAILALAVMRIGIRLKRGAAPLPDNEPAILKFAAHATHWGLYGMLILMPLSGAAAWFFGSESAADAHETLRVVLLLLIFLHIGGALFQAFVLRSDVLSRMTRG